MSKSYVIQWKSRVNGRAGKGSKTFELDEATRLAEELNREYPGIHHEIVEASLPPEPPPAEQNAEVLEHTEAAAEVTQVTHSPDFVFSA